MLMRHKLATWRRLFAVVLVLAVSLGSVIGVAAHASHGPGAHAHHTFPGAAPAKVARGGDIAAPHEASAHADHDADRGQTKDVCLDMLCHGSAAVLPSASGVAFPTRVLVVVMPREAHSASRMPAPLDRPPASFRSL